MVPTSPPKPPSSCTTPDPAKSRKPFSYSQPPPHAHDDAIGQTIEHIRKEKTMQVSIYVSSARLPEAVVADVEQKLNLKSHFKSPARLSHRQKNVPLPRRPPSALFANANPITQNAPMCASGKFLTRMLALFSRCIDPTSQLHCNNTSASRNDPDPQTPSYQPRRRQTRSSCRTAPSALSLLNFCRGCFGVVCHCFKNQARCTYNSYDEPAMQIKHNIF